MYRTQLDSFTNKAMLLYLFLGTKKHGQCRAFLFEMISYITLPASQDAQTRRPKDADIIELTILLCKTGSSLNHRLLIIL